jgi:hypothetical protein
MKKNGGEGRNLNRIYCFLEDIGRDYWRRLYKVQWNWRNGVVEFTVSQEILWLWLGDSSETK